MSIFIVVDIIRQILELCIIGVGIRMLMRHTESLSKDYGIYSKELGEILKTIVTPKPPQQALPPLYLPYDKCMAMFNKYITMTFQRIFTSHVLPTIASTEGKISLLSPNDVKYNDFILEITLQIYEGIPDYLKKSVCFYFGIKNLKDNEDLQVGCLTKHIATTVIALMDNHIVRNAEFIEKHGPSAIPYINAIKRYGDDISKHDETIKKTFVKTGHPVTVQTKDEEEFLHG
jgi:hypothetical protein